ncbi:enoyl-CoA hydratase [Herbaspirillum rubrisubalbicans]|uniref:Enoyl-CoA hydratase n=1 Tax=Herbaspirillum rubrisubalbicans Os34 TaxID=1235827 RepID=A0A6M3ZM85_9BURK|nr:enoyl-CoA hydratase [Herbaspirillum rubrisubalbicans]NQE49992.1 enoyl-CoA hydratase [Herbaspirillum rubrisubalbicans]QJP99676.1 enoyl-CoA hydratase [Herbaspirillum rubrisubalbicans Os34]RAN48816.1 enoyl-CoA hydratase [Herbaspirillum rubrisubalbicans]
MSTVLCEQRGAVRVLVNHDPATRNALNADLYAALTAALDEAQADPQVATIVLTGADGFFCSGGDLRLLAQRRSMAPQQRRARLEGLHDLIRHIGRCSKPVIAAVEGGAAGAGLSLALACDLLVTTRQAQFSVAYVKVGLTPDGGVTAFLAQCLSRQMLTQLCLSGERFNGERLHAMGAVNRLVESGQALEAAVQLATTLAEGPAQAMAGIKHLCQHTYGATLEEQLELEAQHMVLAQGEDEAAEGIHAFLEKRPADFQRLRQAAAPKK